VGTMPAQTAAKHVQATHSFRKDVVGTGLDLLGFGCVCLSTIPITDADLGPVSTSTFEEHGRDCRPRHITQFAACTKHCRRSVLLCL
jgi:hypothetical protein